MSEHTPGPWKSVGRWIIADGVKVGTASHPTTYGQLLANALLMAAGPDMLDALQGLVGLVDLLIPTLAEPQRGAVKQNHRLAAARAAIAKATEP
jgi:hypothetical protein